MSFLLLAPSSLEFRQLPAILAYLIANIHLAVTITSDFSFGLIKLIPFTVHGWIERLVGPSLITLPFILGFADDEAARNFYIGIGIAVIALASLTNYSTIEKAD